MTKTSLLFGALLATTTHVAHADQCAKNPKAVIDGAAHLVKKGATVLEYCEPCRDAAPGKSFVVQTVAVKDGELFINGASIDLAYLFLKTGPDEFKNVGHLTGCDASGTSMKIIGGKPSGPTSLPAQPPGGRPPPPPPSPRPSSADELAGEWTVKLTTRYSSCIGMQPPGVADWKLTYNAGAVTLVSGDGSELAGMIDHRPPTSLIKATLKPKQRPSSAVLQLTMFIKDRIGGVLIRTEKASNPKDPVCVIHQDIQATRR